MQPWRGWSIPVMNSIIQNIPVRQIWYEKSWDWCNKKKQSKCNNQRMDE
jgi:hypothetical protein